MKERAYIRTEYHDKYAERMMRSADIVYDKYKEFKKEYIGLRVK